MINYEEELKKFKPVQDVTDAEGAIYNRELTDVMDLMKDERDKSRDSQEIRRTA